jgi:hypothetical protein
MGIARDELLRIPRQTTALIELGQSVEPRPLWQVLPEPLRLMRQHELFATR